MSGYFCFKGLFLNGIILRNPLDLPRHHHSEDPGTSRIELETDTVDIECKSLRNENGKPNPFLSRITTRPVVERGGGGVETSQRWPGH